MHLPETLCQLGAELLVHYGHSCLVPANSSNDHKANAKNKSCGTAASASDSCAISVSVGVKVLYVFVEIAFDARNLVDCMREGDSHSHTHKP